MACTAWATCSGSLGSGGAGRPVLTSQKWQLRVQVSPRMRKVAVRWLQHSPMLGQWASSHTVCNSLARISRLSQWYVSPVGARTRSQAGRRRGRDEPPCVFSVWLTVNLPPPSILRRNLFDHKW